MKLQGFAPRMALACWLKPSQGPSQSFSKLERRGGALPHIRRQSRTNVGEYLGPGGYVCWPLLSRAAGAARSATGARWRAALRAQPNSRPRRCAAL